MTIVLVLPWPHRDLSPNARPHFMAKARAVKRARQEAAWAAIEAGARAFKDGAVLVTTTVSPPTRAHFDDDNLQARCKAYFDGIADALGIDDRHFKHESLRREEPRKPGSVKIELREAA